MKNVYQSVNNISLIQKKNYLLNITKNRQKKYLIEKCFTIRDLNKLLSNQDVNIYFYACAYHQIVESKSFEELEYHLMMMNCLFHYQSYDDLKEDLMRKLCSRIITVDEYCVIRYLIHFDNMSFVEVMERLYVDYHVDIEECVKICFIEEHYHLAYQFLKLLDGCENTILLDLLWSYSIYDYIALMKHYAKRRPQYQIALEG